jgi:hypothetical protein
VIVGGPVRTGVVVVVVVVPVGVVVVPVGVVVVGVVSVVVGVVPVVVGEVELLLVGGSVVSVVADDEIVDVVVDEVPVSVMARTAPKPPAVRNPAMNRASKIMPAHAFLLGPPSFANGAIPRSPRSSVQSRRAKQSNGTRRTYTTSPRTPPSCPLALPHRRRTPQYRIQIVLRRTKSVTRRPSG